MDINAHLKDASGQRFGTDTNPIYVTIHTPDLSTFAVQEKRVFKNDFFHKVWFKTGRLWMWIGVKAGWY